MEQVKNNDLKNGHSQSSKLVRDLKVTARFSTSGINFLKVLTRLSSGAGGSMSILLMRPEA